MSVEEELDRERPEAFRFENEGDQIIGVVRGYEEAFGQFGPETICIVEDDQGNHQAVWLYGSVLKQQFAKLRPKVGEEVGIRYIGKQTPRGGGNPYKVFRVVVPGREGSEPNWDRLAGIASEEVELPEQAVPAPAPQAGVQLPTNPPRPQQPQQAVPRPPTPQELLQRAANQGALERQAVESVVNTQVPPPDVSQWQDPGQQIVQGPITTESRVQAQVAAAQAQQPSTPIIPQEPSVAQAAELQSLPATDMQARALDILSERLGVPPEEWGRYNRQEAAELIAAYQDMAQAQGG